jgi:predicted HTH transcriptional regulator
LEGAIGFSARPERETLMEIDQSRIDDLVARPSESLNVEIKRWINPAEPEGQGKIIKAAFAIRNRNGGFLLIGFNDVTLLPDQTSAPSDVQTAFHLDVIQGLISRYASEPFEIAVGFATRDGQKYPVVVVPEGVRTPVAVQRDLPDPRNSNRALIRKGELYFRTLASNGTPSTRWRAHRIGRPSLKSVSKIERPTSDDSSGVSFLARTLRVSSKH